MRKKLKTTRTNNYLPSPEDIEQQKLRIRLRNEKGRYVMNEKQDDDREVGEERRLYVLDYIVPPDEDVCQTRLLAESRNDAIIRFRLQGNFCANILRVEEVKEQASC